MKSGRTYIVVVKVADGVVVDPVAPPSWSAELEGIINSAACGPGNPYEYIWDPSHPRYVALLQELLDRKDYADAARGHTKESKRQKASLPSVVGALT
jgi:hypothetical protein